jgi:hypothetical protein
MASPVRHFSKAGPVLDRALLLLLPFAMLLIGLRQIADVQPFYQFDYDPSYVYLLNGLLLILGYAPGHYDHPGTPAQMVAGLAIFVRWIAGKLAGADDGGIVRSVLTDPESYLTAIAHVFLTLAAIANLYLGYRIRRATGHIGYALIAQSGPLFLGEQMLNVFYLSAEPGLIIVSMLFLAVLSDRIFGADVDRDASVQTSLAAGLLGGLGLAIKVTFLPLLALLLVLGSVRAWVVAGLAVVATFIVCVAPVLPVLEESLRFYGRIASHIENYGTGDAGFMDWSLLPRRISIVADAQPLFLVGIGLTFVALLWIALKRDRLERLDFRWLLLVTLALLLAQFGSLLLGIKHFGVKYMLPGFLTTSVALAWLTFLCSRLLDPLRLRALPLLMAGTLPCVGAWQVWNFQTSLADRHAQNSAQLARLNDVLKQYPGAALIAGYHAPSVGHAIHFGLGYTRGHFIAEANALRPNQLMMGGKVMNRPGGESVPISEVDKFVASDRPVLLITYRSSDVTAYYRVERLADLGTVQVYRVKGAALPTH